MLAAVYITANISGGHLNPAVTVATLCTGHISLLKAAAYIVAQIVGAISAHLIQASQCCWLPVTLLALSRMPSCLPHDGGPMQHMTTLECMCECECNDTVWAGAKCQYW